LKNLYDGLRASGVAPALWTNHVIGDGWWSWWIPLKGGDVSVGVVFDQRIVDWPHASGKLGDRLKKFLMLTSGGARDAR
jgi:flavin-dependent dehydrogenase